jgi:ribonuclease P protein component
MPPKKERLTKKEIKDALQKGVRFFGPTLDIIVVEASYFKCAVVVSKRNVKKAVARNTVRRRIYNALQKNKHLFGSCHTIVLTKSGIEKLSLQDVEDTFIHMQNTQSKPSHGKHAPHKVK